MHSSKNSRAIILKKIRGWLNYFLSHLDFFSRNFVLKFSHERSHWEHSCKNLRTKIIEKNRGASKKIRGGSKKTSTSVEFFWRIIALEFLVECTQWPLNALNDRLLKLWNRGILILDKIPRNFLVIPRFYNFNSLTVECVQPAAGNVRHATPQVAQTICCYDILQFWVRLTQCFFKKDSWVSSSFWRKIVVFDCFWLVVVPVTWHKWSQIRRIIWRATSGIAASW